MKKHWRILLSMGMATVALAAFGSLTHAQTLAYWRFEGGPATMSLDPVTHGATDGYNFAPDVADSSGNGNALSVWTTAGCCGFAYRSDVPFSAVTQTGQPNNFSVKNTGANPASFTNPAGPLGGLELSQWTIEASLEAGKRRISHGRRPRCAERRIY